MAGALIGFLLLTLLVSPLYNFPMGDDWEYARTAQRLLTTGQFYRSPVVQTTALFPGVWGALFSLLFGFSFTTLRLSTFPLAAGTLLSFYFVLDELGFDATRRLLGTFALMVPPLFVFNANSFMTDVPFLFWLMLGLWLSLHAFRTGIPTWLAAGSICAALAFLTRQLGLALSAAVILAVLVYRPRAEWRRWLAASAAIPLGVTAAFYVWQALSGQTTWADATITDQGTLQFIFSPQLPAALARRIVLMLVSLNLYILPLWLAFLPQWRKALAWLRGRWAAAVILALFFLGSVTFFGARGEWWPYYQGSLTNAGLWPALAFFAYPHDVRPPFLPLPVWIGMTYLGAVLAVLLTLNFSVRVAHAAGINGRNERTTIGTTKSIVARLEQAARLFLARLQSVGPVRGLVYLTFLVQLAFVLVYSLFVERYFLPFLPGIILLLFDSTRRVNLSPVPAITGILVVGVLSVGLMWDYFGWHAARWNEAEALVASGVPLEKLDAGYEWDGWYLSDEAYRYVQEHGVPLTPDPFEYVLDPQYMVTFTPQPGYTIARKLPFATPFRAGGQDNLLLLQREGAP